jgi:hypothetical protein
MRFPLFVPADGSILHSVARWQSGYAAACKAVDIGSIPVRASSLYSPAVLARVVKQVDTRDLKSLGFGRTGSSPVPGTIFPDLGLVATRFLWIILITA